jgi:hypothetical protein
MVHNSAMTIKYCHALLVLFILLISIPTGVFSKNMDITFTNDRINISADNTALSSIIEELSKQMDIKVYLDKSQVGKSITVDIRNVPFEKGLKLLAYPLNYVIVRDSEGNIKELRIFKNPGLMDRNYTVFGNTGQAVSAQVSGDKSQGTGDQRQGLEVRSQKSEVRNEASAVNPSSSAVTSAAVTSSVGSSQSGSSASEAVTGDKAFNYGIWATQRMHVYEAMREQAQVRTDQANALQKELAPIQNTVNISNITQQAMSQNPQQTSSPVQLSSNPQNNPSYQTGNYNNNYNNSMNIWMTSYMQQMSQQRSFNEFIYYQQKAYNNYTSILNSRGQAAR